MKKVSWRHFAIGLVLGEAISFVVGFLYAYVVWNPPSDEFGSEKTWTNILLIPAVLVGLVIAVMARKPLRSLFSAAHRIGLAGLVGSLIGAAILPVAELAEMAVEWRGVMVQLPAERAAMLAQLAAIGVQLKQAQTVVLEGHFMAEGPLDPFIYRLSSFTTKPVFVVYDEHGGRQPMTMRKYQIGSGTACQQIKVKTPPYFSRQIPDTVDKCLTGVDVPDFEDWPSTGALLSIDWFVLGDDPVKWFAPGRIAYKKPPDPANDHNLYVNLTLATLRKPPASPTIPYMPPYDRAATPKTVWKNWCFFKRFGPFPFGRGSRWAACADLLKLTDVADVIFGTAPLATAAGRQ